MDKRPGMKFRSAVNRKSKTCPAFDKLRSRACRGELRRSIQNRKLVGLFALVVTLAMCGAVAEAQQPKKVPRIGYLSALDPATESTRSEAIRLGLREFGYIEGQNIAIEYRYAQRKVDWAPELAAQLVRLKVDLMVVAGGDTWILAGCQGKPIWQHYQSDGCSRSFDPITTLLESVLTIKLRLRSLSVTCCT